MKNYFRRREQGMALVHVTLVLVLTMLVIPPLLGFVGGAGRTAQILEGRMQGQYAADAGWELASYQVLNELQPPANGTNYVTADSVNGYDVDVAVDPVDDATYRITSEATDYEGKTTTVVSHIYRTLEYFQDPLFDHALAADTSLTLRRDNTVNGDIHSNGYIAMDTGALVLGDATAATSITGGNVTGNRVEGAPPLEWPSDFETQGFKNEAMSNPYPGNYTVAKGPATIYLGPLYVAGDLHIMRDNTVVIEGTIYVEGTVQLDRNTTLTGTGALVAQLDIALNQMLASSAEDNLFLMSVNGDIRVDQQVNSRGLIFAPKGHIEIAQDSVFSGSIVGSSVLVNKNSSITYEHISDIWYRIPSDYSPTEWLVLDYVIER